MMSVFLSSLVTAYITLQHVQGWVIMPTMVSSPLQRCNRLSTVRRLPEVLFSTPPTEGGSTTDNDGQIRRTTFDEAGKSLVDEEDNKRMEAMGDYDLNPDVSCLVCLLH